MINSSTESLSLEGALKHFSDLPPESILKQDVLRLGISFEQSVFSSQENYKPKDYFIFSFDMISLEDQDNRLVFKAPEEIRISGGPFALEPTVISVRIHPESPYIVKLHEGVPSLYYNEENLGPVEFHGRPDFYGSELSGDYSISELLPVLEWGYLLYITAFRLCQYWGEKEECRFCDINANYRQQKKAGRPYTGVKPVEAILEALEIVAEKDHTAKAYTLTGGSITSELQGLGEVDFYLQYIKAIEEKFPGRWISKAVVQAFADDDLQRLKDAGLQIYHPNYEVWDAKLFSELCPGKTAMIGRDRWIRQILKAAEIFSPAHVIPNFVGGVEMCRPYGFENVEKAIQSTREGLDFFMSHGVVPRFTTWCPEPLAALGSQPAPPLEYFCRLLQTWRDRFEYYNLPVPPGYGEAGPGKAVFSVSAFMDVIRP